MTNSVSTASIIGMFFSLFVAIGAPVILCVLMRMKKKAKLSSCFIGMGTFIVSALILEQILHVIVLRGTGTLITGNIWLYALYGGLAAGLFEETGRYFAMKLLMKKNLNRENALMYGVGHGGIEAIIIVGLAEINNIVTSFLINSGQAELLLNGSNETVMASLSQLWLLPPYQFYMAGIERLTAIALHISLSYFVYRAVKEHRIGFYFLAVALHFLVDGVTVAASVFLPVTAIEGVLILMVAGIGFWVYKMYRAAAPDRNEKQAEAEG